MHGAEAEFGGTHDDRRVAAARLAVAKTLGVTEGAPAPAGWRRG